MTNSKTQTEANTDPRYLARIAIFNGPCLKEPIAGYSVNVSTGGLFIETEKVLPVDTMLMIKFKLPGMDSVISCHSRVAWTNEPGAERKLSLPAGMGIQFIDMALDDLHAIRHYIENGKLVPTW